MAGFYHELMEKRSEILHIAKAQGHTIPVFFGSVGRSEKRIDGDLDLVIDFEPERSLNDHVALIQDLDARLGRRIDMVTEGGLHGYIRDRVIKEAVPL